MKIELSANQLAEIIGAELEKPFRCRMYDDTGMLEGDVYLMKEGVGIFVFHDCSDNEKIYKLKDYDFVNLMLKKNTGYGLFKVRQKEEV